MSTALAVLDTEELFDLEPYKADQLTLLEQATSPGHVAVRIEKHEPVKFAKILRRLKEGVPLLRLATDFGVSRNTLKAIIVNKLGGMKKYREGLAEECLDAAKEGVVRVGELIGKGDNVVQVAVATKIMVETGLLLSGMSAESSTDTPLDPKVREDWNEKLRQMRERRKGALVEVVEDTNGGARALTEEGEGS